MPELGASGSVRGTLRNERFYRERYTEARFISEHDPQATTAPGRSSPGLPRSI